MSELISEEVYGDIQSDVDLTKYLMVVRKKEEEVEELKRQAAEHAEWFKNRIASVENTIGFLTAKMQSYVEEKGVNSISLPAGRVGFRRTWSVDWPSNEDLVEWSRMYGIPTRIKEEPDKKALATYIEETGNYPSGYVRTQNTKLYVNTNGTD